VFVRVKVCCIQDEAEARLAIDAGAHALGFVGPGLSGPEVMDEGRIQRVVRSVPPGVASFLLTRVSDPAALAAQVLRCGANVVQICDEVEPEAWAAVRAAAPWVRIAQVVHVQDERAIARAQAVAPHVDAVLLDSGTPTGPNPVFGGSGRTHDWQLSARIVEVVDRPVWLAGGLRADNIVEAIRTVRPFGVDLCSGVRADGRLNPERLAAFFAAVRVASGGSPS
jgi:phosphoribosylanthranilate isomerase